MILDRLANHRRYLGLHPRLEAGFAWLASRDWSQVADGRHEIVGEFVYASVEGGVSAAPAQRRFESHRRFLDIQYSITGGERMGWCPGDGLAVAEQAGPDLWFHAEPVAAAFPLVAPGWFTIFVPGEAHKPCCHAGDAAAAFRKCVVKVAWD